MQNMNKQKENISQAKISDAKTFDDIYNQIVAANNKYNLENMQPNILQPPQKRPNNEEKLENLQNSLT